MWNLLLLVCSRPQSPVKNQQKTMMMIKCCHITLPFSSIYYDYTLLMETPCLLLTKGMINTLLPVFLPMPTSHLDWQIGIKPGLTKLLLLPKLLPSTDIFFAQLLGVGLTCYVIWYLINKAYQMTLMFNQTKKLAADVIFSLHCL